MFEKMAQTGKPVEALTIHRIGNYLSTVEKGQALVGSLAAKLQAVKREQVPVVKIKLAVKCGSSDATSGLAANLAPGLVVDQLIDLGATVTFGEATEFIGAEHILCQRGITAEVRDKILGITKNMEDRIRATGLDMRGTQPSRGNGDQHH